MGKKDEFQRREKLIIREASRLLNAEGYFGLSLDKLAQAVGYAKGTLYQHFKTKEDIVLAIAAEGLEERRALFQRAVAFNGCPRERMTAILVADLFFVQLFPAHFDVEHLIKARSLWAKTSRIRQTQLHQVEQDCGSAVLNIVEAAAAAGDLKLNGRHAAEVGFGLWTMSLGVHTLVNSAGLAGSPDLPRFGIDAPYESLWNNQMAFLDGLQWKPLSSTWDYDAVRGRIVKEIFNDESQRTKLANS